MTPALSRLTKLLANPSKIGQSLDWHKATGSVLTMCIGWDRIDVAVASHPSTNLDPQPLQSIPATTSVIAGNRRRVVSSAVASELQRTAEQFRACGVVVHWPLQAEGGWCGAHCGRVWFTLEQVADGGAFRDKPLCLWNASGHRTPQVEDSWGRSPVYAAAVPIPGRAVYRSSREQPQPSPADVWNDYCRAQWPALDPPVRWSPSDDATSPGQNRRPRASSASPACRARPPPPPIPEPSDDLF